MKLVPHSGPPTSPVWVIGEAPSESDVESGLPFSGVSGKRLRESLALAGWPNESTVYFGSICNYPPPINNIYETLPKNLIKEGEAYLQLQIETYKPKVILACGEKALNFLTGKSGIQNWRGSILSCILFPSTKVVPSLHPRIILKSPSDYPLFQFDLERAYKEVFIDGLQYLPRDFIIFPSGLELEEAKDNFFKGVRASPEIRMKVAVDIESIRDSTTILCIGFAWDKQHAITLDWNDLSQRQFAIEILSDQAIDKIFHFGTFDTLMLLENGIETVNYIHDTMVAQHILEPELPRGLDFLCSTYTREPYYKGDGRANIPLDTKVWSNASLSSGRENLGIYNCKDCCITYEIHEQQLEELIALNLLDFYNEEMELVSIARDISRNGMFVDTEMRILMLKSQMVRWEELQFGLNTVYSYLTGKVQSINVNSPKAVQRALYDELNLTEKKKRNKDGVFKRTADDDALVDLLTFVAGMGEKVKSKEHKLNWQFKLQFLQFLREIRGLRKLISSYLANSLSPDGRVRGVYKVASTDTGRWANESYIDGTGFNIQTFPRADVALNPELADKTLDEIGLSKEQLVALLTPETNDE